MNVEHTLVCVDRPTKVQVRGRVHTLLPGDALHLSVEPKSPADWLEVAAFAMSQANRLHDFVMAERMAIGDPQSKPRDPDEPMFRAPKLDLDLRAGRLGPKKRWWSRGSDMGDAEAIAE